MTDQGRPLEKLKTASPQITTRARGANRFDIDPEMVYNPCRISVVELISYLRKERLLCERERRLR